MLAPLFIASLLFNVLIEDKLEGFNDVQLASLQLFISPDKCSFNSSVISHREIMTFNLCNALQKLFICGLHSFCALFDCSQFTDTWKYKPSL